MKIECINYVKNIMIKELTSRANNDQIEKFKNLFPDTNWDAGFDKTLKEYAKNKTRTEYIIEEICKFMKQENLLGEFES